MALTTLCVPEPRLLPHIGRDALTGIEVDTRRNGSPRDNLRTVLRNFFAIGLPKKTFYV